MMMCSKKMDEWDSPNQAMLAQLTRVQRSERHWGPQTESGSW
jgi:hypothetical protein